jgi:hypothetical protein
MRGVQCAADLCVRGTEASRRVRIASDSSLTPPLGDQEDVCLWFVVLNVLMLKDEEDLGDLYIYVYIYIYIYKYVYIYIYIYVYIYICTYIYI